MSRVSKVVGIEANPRGAHSRTVGVALLLWAVGCAGGPAETGPYFHDGSIATIEEAVEIMGYYQLGQQLDDAQIAEIVAFLGSLTGKPDPDYVAKPELPASGPDTPSPDPS